MSNNQTTGQYSERLDEIEFKLDGIEGKQTQILNLLSGNSMNKADVGLVGDVVALKVKVEKLERWKDKVIYVMIGVSFGAGWGFADLLTELFKKIGK